MSRLSRIAFSWRHAADVAAPLVLILGIAATLCQTPPASCQETDATLVRRELPPAVAQSAVAQSEIAQSEVAQSSGPDNVDTAAADDTDSGSPVLRGDVLRPRRTWGRPPVLRSLLTTASASPQATRTNRDKVSAQFLSEVNSATRHDVAATSPRLPPAPDSGTHGIEQSARRAAVTHHVPDSQHQPTARETRLAELSRYSTTGSSESRQLALPKLMFRAVMGVCLSLVLCLFIVVVSQRRLRPGKPGDLSQEMKLLHTIYLAPRCCLHIVRINDHTVIVGRDATGMTDIVPLPATFAEQLSRQAVTYDGIDDPHEATADELLRRYRAVDGTQLPESAHRSAGSPGSQWASTLPRRSTGLELETSGGEFGG